MFKYLIQKEFIQLVRNPFLPKLILIFPVVIMCVIPWVMSMEVKNIVVDVVDNDHSMLSQQLVHGIEASNYFIFHGQKQSYEEALADIEKSEADAVVVIPPHYSRDKQNGEQPQILIAANAVNSVKGSIGSSYLNNIVQSKVSANSTSEAISILYLYNKNLNYKLFMIPALLGILMMLLCGFLPALNIVSEKESGTIEQINVTPVTKMSFIFSKLVLYWIIGLVVMSICLLLSWAVYGITSAGNLLLLYLLAILMALIFSGIGLVVSNYNETMQQAVFVMWFIVVVLMMLSGLFTPVKSMPDWAQATTTVNPMHYFIDAVRTVFVRGGDFRSVASQVLVLSIFALIIDSWAIYSYRKNN